MIESRAKIRIEIDTLLLFFNLLKYSHISNCGLARFAVEAHLFTTEQVELQ
jgi:hypothetical protein